MAALALGPGAKPALAHGVGVGEAPPLPIWLFLVGTALVLGVSFAALVVLRPDPHLEESRWRPLPAGLSGVLSSRSVEVLCGLVGVLLLVVVVVSGIRGTQVTKDNLAPTFVYVTFWLGMVGVSVVFGDVFRAFNPWRACGRVVALVSAKAAGGPLPPPLRYPDRLGRWPAVVGLTAFAFLESAVAGSDQPDRVAVAVLIYSALTFLGMALFGVEAWSQRGEAFSVYFNLLSRMSPLERRGGRLGLRPPLSGLRGLEQLPGTVALMGVMIGSVSFDGLSAGPTWQKIVAPVKGLFESAGFGSIQAIELVYALGLVATIALVAGFYRVGAAGAASVGGGLSAGQVARAFVHSLVPIAAVYSAAHYVSLLLLQGQAIVPLASDPLGQGRNLFGTSDAGVDLQAIAPETFWWIQLALVLAGHVGALGVAHDRALALYADRGLAARSQYRMLGVMICFTTFALWLLSEAGKG
ncbi:MAG: fenitrothion hydrolase [Actinomycetota bacterium]|nr:fenitrothion hydrolase [Actinomycetota bacterium]